MGGEKICNSETQSTLCLISKLWSNSPGHGSQARPSLFHSRLNLILKIILKLTAMVRIMYLGKKESSVTGVSKLKSKRIFDAVVISPVHWWPIGNIDDIRNRSILELGPVHPLQSVHRSLHHLHVVLIVCWSVVGVTIGRHPELRVGVDGDEGSNVGAVPLHHLHASLDCLGLRLREGWITFVAGAAWISWTLGEESWKVSVGIHSMRAASTLTPSQSSPPSPPAPPALATSLTPTHGSPVLPPHSVRLPTVHISIRVSHGENVEVLEKKIISLIEDLNKQTRLREDDNYEKNWGWDIIKRISLAIDHLCHTLCAF